MTKPYANYQGLIGLIHKVQVAMDAVREVSTLALDIHRIAPEEQHDDLSDALRCIGQASAQLQRAFNDLDELAHKNAPDRTTD